MAKLAAEVTRILKGCLDKTSKSSNYISAENDLLIAASFKAVVFAIAPNKDRLDGYYTKEMVKIDHGSIDGFDFPKWRNIVLWKGKPNDIVVFNTREDIVWNIFSKNLKIDLYYLNLLPTDAEAHVFFFKGQITIFYPEFFMFVTLRTGDIDPDIGIKSGYKTVEKIFKDVTSELGLQLELGLED